MIAAAPIGASLSLLWLTSVQRSRTVTVIAASILAILVISSPDVPQLAATIAIEAAVVFGFSFRFGIDPVGAVLVCGFVNAITQPLLYVGLQNTPMAGGNQWWLVLAAAEVVVSIVEALLYLSCLADMRRATHPVTKSFTLSLSANIVSTALGLALPW